MINKIKLMKIIAKQEGYEFIDLNDNPHGVKVRGENIVAKDWLGENVAWGWNFDDVLRGLPQWLDDESAAINLLRDCKEWTIERVDGVDPFHCIIHSMSSKRSSSRFCQTIAYAVVDAYLSYHEINESW